MVFICVFFSAIGIEMLRRSDRGTWDCGRYLQAIRCRLQYTKTEVRASGRWYLSLQVPPHHIVLSLVLLKLSLHVACASASSFVLSRWLTQRMGLMPFSACASAIDDSVQKLTQTLMQTHTYMLRVNNP